MVKIVTIHPEYPDGRGFCDSCDLKCTVTINGRCAKTDSIIQQITARWGL